MNYKLINNTVNPIVKSILRSPFRFLLPKDWAVLTYTGRKTHKKRSLPMRVAQYEGEFINVPGCFQHELPAWWHNFHKESMANLLYRGRSMECLATVIEGDETAATPRIAAYLRQFLLARGITDETTEEMLNTSVTMAAKTHSIVVIRSRSSYSSSNALDRK